MWGLLSKKRFREEMMKIANSFKSRDKEISELRANIVSKDTIKLMIENEILKVHKPVQTSARTAKRKKADRILDKAEIMHEIASMLQKGLSTNEAYNQIVNVKKLCGRTCFFKYLKIVREQTPRTPRTIKAN